MTVLMPLGMFWTLKRWLGGEWAIPWWLLAVLIFVNCLSIVNLTRVFRLVFLGQTQSKTHRTPEVAWPMALPMVALILIALLAPIIPLRWDFWLSFTNPLLNNQSFTIVWGFPLLIASGVIGLVIGLTVELRRAWARPTGLIIRFLQDLFAYDFYLDRIYQFTVVLAVGSLSKITAWIDRYIIDGLVNLVSLATIFSGSALKYNVSGQSQFYVLTILFGIGGLIWLLLNGQWSLITNYWSSLLTH
jgi:NAD(P)H-quinone oxidoreductase subunit 5